MNINTLIKSNITRYFAFAVIASSALVSSCTPTTQVSATWKDPNLGTKQYTNVFIVAVFPQLATRATIENQLSTNLTNDGVKTTLSSTILPPDTKFTTDSAKQAFIAQLRKAGCDGIVTVTLQNKQETVSYVPGTASYAPGFWGPYGFGAMGAGFYGTPGYYDTDVTYYMTTSLYDINTEKMVWTAQTTTTDPSSMQSAAPQYAQLMVSKMEEAGVIPVPPAPATPTKKK